MIGVADAGTMEIVNDNVARSLWIVYDEIIFATFACHTNISFALFSIYSFKVFFHSVRCEFHIIEWTRFCSLLAARTYQCKTTAWIYDLSWYVLIIVDRIHVRIAHKSAQILHFYMLTALHKTVSQPKYSQ